MIQRAIVRSTILAALIGPLVAVPFLAQQTAHHPAAQIPKNSKAAAEHNNLGVAYMDRQEARLAVAEFRIAQQADPSLIEPRLNLAIALLNTQQLQPSRAILEALAKRDPENLRVWYNLGLIEKATGRTQQSAEDFERVTTADPGDADAHYLLGQDYLALRDYPKAVASLDLALKANPFHASAEFALAQAYQRSGDSSRAQEHYSRFQHLVETKLGAPMATTYGEQGKYSLAIEIAPGTNRVAPAAAVHFEDVSAASGLPMAVAAQNGQSLGASDTFGSGACAFDFDGDGRPDLFLADVSGHPALYRNLGGGKFEDVTAKSGITLPGMGMGCSAGDYDNDGRPDLAVTYAGGVALFHNEGDGKFRDVTSEAGIRLAGRALGVTFVDYDHDGDLDLYVTRAPATESSASASVSTLNSLWRNDGNGTFTDVTGETGLASAGPNWGATASDINNDRAVDLVVTSFSERPSIFFNQREGPFRSEQPWGGPTNIPAVGAVPFDFNNDGWMDLAFTLSRAPGLSLWRNDGGKAFTQVALPQLDWTRGWGLSALDYDNDGWLDLAAVGEDSFGGHIALLRNEAAAGFRDVSKEVGLDSIHLVRPRSLIRADFFGDGGTDLLITQNGGPPVLLHNRGTNRNHRLQVQLKGLNDNHSAIGTKVEVYAGLSRQKLEIPAASGYLGQNDTAVNVGLGTATKADVVRMLWPTGVLQDEIRLAANSTHAITEIDRRGSSCPILFAWNGREFQFVADLLGPGILGHWLAPGKNNVSNPIEYLKVDGSTTQAKNGQLSFRLLEPEEELDYLDHVRLLAVDHPADVEVNSNGHFSMNPPFPAFQVVASREPRALAGARDDSGRDVLSLLSERDHQFVSGFDGPSFAGFARTHWVELDLGSWDAQRPLRLILDGFTDYFSASSLYSAWQAGMAPVPPYVEALAADGHWHRVVDDMGFPAGLERTMTLDLTGKLPPGTRKIRIVTNLKIYWDRIRVDNSGPETPYRIQEVPLASARLEFRGFPRYAEGPIRGDLSYTYKYVSMSGPYARQAGSYTRYGDVAFLLSRADEKYVVFGAGDEVAVNFDVSAMGAPPAGWVRDYFFYADGFDKDMDFYADFGDTVSPMPIHSANPYPYPTNASSYPTDEDHLRYLLQYNTRAVSGNPPASYRFDYRDKTP